MLSKVLMLAYITKEQQNCKAIIYHLHLSIELLHTDKLHMANPV